MQYSEITRKFEFDAGHRVPNHKSKCRNLHGHRYRLDVTVGGFLVDEKGTSDEGMVLDFGDLKQIVMEHLIDKWDHAFIVHKDDLHIKNFLIEEITDFTHKTVVVPLIPTAENLVIIAAHIIGPKIAEWGKDRNVTLVTVRLYETPNCWADYAYDEDESIRINN